MFRSTASSGNSTIPGLTKTITTLSLPKSCLLLLMCLTALPLAAQADNDIVDIITSAECIQTNLNNRSNIADAVACLPQGCKITLTMSPFSLQKACKLPLNAPMVQLPHIVLNCPGPVGGSVLRLRPSFTLCPNQAGNEENAVEFGQDNLPQGPFVPGNIFVPGDLMGSIPFTPPEALNVNNRHNCVNCHGLSGQTYDVKYMGNKYPVKLDIPIDPFFGKGARPLIYAAIDTTEPNRKILVNPTMFKKQALADICADIKRFAIPGVNLKLCENLADYEDKRSCGKTADPKVHCSGVVGGGLFQSENNPAQLSVVTLDFSGQAELAPEYARFLDLDGGLTAFNYQTQRFINNVVLTSLSGFALGPQHFRFMGIGTATVGGKQNTKVRIDIEAGNTTFTVVVTNSDTGQIEIDGTMPINGSQFYFN